MIYTLRLPVKIEPGLITYYGEYGTSMFRIKEEAQCVDSYKGDAIRVEDHMLKVIKVIDLQANHLIYGDLNCMELINE